MEDAVELDAQAIFALGLEVKRVDRAFKEIEDAADGPGRLVHVGDLRSRTTK